MSGPPVQDPALRAGRSTDPVDPTGFAPGARATPPRVDRRRIRILVADDEEGMRYFVGRALQRHGFVVESVEDGAAAVRRLDESPCDVAVLDLKMPGRDGIEVLRHIRERTPDAVVLLMTAFGTIASAVEAMRLGASDYITKPFEIEELLLRIERGLEHRAVVAENRGLRELVDTRTGFAGLVGQSTSMRTLFDRITLLRQTDSTVLVRGESGTGKELVARAIHMESPRARGEFVAIHCAALPENLFENELFGHEPGAFTGATSRKTGLCARADGGTLFLDEISETPLAMQVKLERFLQQRSFVRLGATEPTAVDVRVCAATNKDLEQLVAEHRFRKELYFRLNVVPIELPPLRRRREDVPALVDHLLARLRREQGVSLRGFTVDAALALARYDWPGNVRELQNTLERLAVLNPGRELLDVADLPRELVESRMVEAARRSDHKGAVTSFERQYFAGLMREVAGNISEVARIAGLSRGHLHRKLKQLGIDPDTYRS